MHRGRRLRALSAQLLPGDQRPIILHGEALTPPQAACQGLPTVADHSQSLGRPRSGQVRSGQVSPGTTVHKPAIKRPTAGRLAETHALRGPERAPSGREGNLPQTGLELGNLGWQWCLGRSAPDWLVLVGAHAGPSDSN